MANILCVMLLQMNWIQSFTMCSVPYIPNVVERQLENMCKDFFSVKTEDDCAEIQ